jgi:hypothetical protein
MSRDPPKERLAISAEISKERRDVNGRRIP